MYEYIVIYDSVNMPLGGLSEKLNNYGRKGFRLVSSDVMPGGDSRFILEKQTITSIERKSKMNNVW